MQPTEKQTIEKDFDPGFEIIKSRGKKAREFWELMPHAVHDIVAQMINERDIRVRSRLQNQMKAIVNLICTDTYMSVEELKDKSSFLSEE